MAVADRRPDLVLVDWMLPDASGLELTRSIKKAKDTHDVPVIMLTAPGPATLRCLKKAGMTIKDIDLIEVNEAFAAVVLKFLRDTGADWDKCNVNGGAIALGHPIGATGGMLIGTAVDELERTGKQTALITMCTGGGMGTATIIERV